MNKSEIAERLRCQMHGEKCLDASCHHFLKYHDPRSEFYLGTGCVNCCFADVERAIAESQAPQPPNSQLCTCHSGYNQFCCRHGLNGYFQRKEKSEKTELGDGEPSPQTHIHELDDSNLTHCVICGKELRSGAAQEVSPFASILPENAEPKLDMRMDDDLEEVSPPIPLKHEWFLHPSAESQLPGGQETFTRKETAEFAEHFKKYFGDTRELKAASKEFVIAVERLLDWMNGNDLSADHEAACPDDFKKLCASLTALKRLLG